MILYSNIVNLYFIILHLIINIVLTGVFLLSLAKDKPLDYMYMCFLDFTSTERKNFIWLDILEV